MTTVDAAFILGGLLTAVVAAWGVTRWPGVVLPAVGCVVLVGVGAVCVYAVVVLVGAARMGP